MTNHNDVASKDMGQARRRLTPDAVIGLSDVALDARLSYTSGSVMIDERYYETVKALVGALREVERHCPCGARPESLRTHPHVISCPVGRVLGGTVADNYEEAVRDR